MTKEEIGNYIRYLRLKNNYSQEQLAEKVGFSRGRVIAIENNTRSYKIDALLKVINALEENLYISSKEGYDNHIINQVAIRIEQQILSAFKEPINHQLYGWVYIIMLQIDSSIIKIGLTKKDKVEERINYITDYFHPGMDPEKSKSVLYYTRLASDCRKIELEMHKLFKDHRLKGEWFNIDCEIAKKELDILINNLDTPHL